MPRFVSSLSLACALFASLLAADARAAVAGSSTAIDYDRDIRPILSENCFYCHGADSARRMGKLRLDVPGAAVERGVLIAGKPDDSEIIKRIHSTKDDEQMPPPDSNRHLSPEQKQLLAGWIAAGGKYEEHWAFRPVVRVEPPAVKQRDWPRNPIDNFILATLEQNSLTPSKPEAIEPLLRRVSLDLAGLPPTREQMQRWLAEPDPYSVAVEELLASPHFGERMASDWMDVARYADTHGFNNDSLRVMWPWRDWVINSFNENLPYDQFITAQLAGDLLPNATVQDRVASGFNRNGVINSEGGIIDEEYRTEYVADRVRTTSLAWMGLTMECSRCHDHKFDPITQKDYYRYFAFFNNINEGGEDGRNGNASPLMRAPTIPMQKNMGAERQQMAESALQMEQLLARQRWKHIKPNALLASLTLTNILPQSNRLMLLPETLAEARPSTNHFVTNLAGGKPFIVTGPITNSVGPLGETAFVFPSEATLRIDKLAAHPGSKGWMFNAWVRRDSAGEGILFSTMNYTVPMSSQSYGRGIEVRLTPDGAVDVRIARRWPSYSLNVVSRDSIPTNTWKNILVVDDGSGVAKGTRIYVDGEECFLDIRHDDFAEDDLDGRCIIGGAFHLTNAPVFIGALAGLKVVTGPIDAAAFARHSAAEALKFAAQFTDAKTAPLAVEQWHRAWLTAYNSVYADAAHQYETTRNQLLAAERQAPVMMVMQEKTVPRKTHLLFRGNYTEPREELTAATPAFLPIFTQQTPRTRLELAQWFTDPKNPLTARVVVNRFWQNFFGTGIVKTSDNFGYQGDWPSHPELLDWLASEFIQSGWDVKHLMRLMVESAAYRQDTGSNPDLNERDPENRLLAHGPRQRLTAEMLRDQALAVSGLLHDELGGPSVFPYQPKNLYKGIVVEGLSASSYSESTGEELYRRSVYTFWKRTVLIPTLAVFDAPDRETCIIRRSKTNTPQQALALMNDTVQLEAARKLAERMLQEGGADEAHRLDFAFELATARKPQPEEEKILRDLLTERLAYYRANPKAATDFLANGASPVAAGVDPVMLAGYANIASLVLNLDETVTRN